MVDGEVARTWTATGTLARGEHELRSGTTVYLRVVDAVDGLPELAWSSPLFLRSPE